MSKIFTILVVVASLIIFTFVFKNEFRTNIPQEITENIIEKPRPVPSDEIDKINTNEKIVVFTFDAGAGNNSLNKILDVLEKYSIKGTFFLTGKWAEENPLLTKQISEEGHEIFNHTYGHPYLTKLSSEEITDELNKANEIIFNITGKSSAPFFRPPYGDRNQSVRETAAQAGFQDVYWTVDALDWKEDYTAEQSKERILSNLKPGAIYLMHIGDDITGIILDEVFSEVQKQGYQILSLTQALQANEQ